MIKATIILMACLALSSCTIVITSPLQTNFTNNQIEYKYGNFGEVPYGKTITAQLFITQNSLCNKDDLEHFTKPTYVVVRINIGQTCSETKRALYAQSKGAKGIIFASRSYESYSGKIVLGNDGNGRKVHITPIYVNFRAFDSLSQLKNVEISANFSVPKQTVSTMSIFISSAKRSSYFFLRKLKQKYPNIKNYVKIQPVYHAIECEYCSSENCVEGYCSFDYEHWDFKTGSNIVNEELHQYAIFDQKREEVWLEYMDKFDEYCMGNWNDVAQCSKDILKQMGVTDTFHPNALHTLRLWDSNQKKIGFNSFPEVAINNMIYSGNFDIDDVMKAFCQSLLNPPQYCIDGTVAVPEQEPPKKGHLAIILAVLLISVGVVVFAVMMIYKKCIKKEITTDMTSKVGELVAHYASKVNKKKIRHNQKLMEANDEEL